MASARRKNADNANQMSLFDMFDQALSEEADRKPTASLSLHEMLDSILSECQLEDEDSLVEPESVEIFSPPVSVPVSGAWKEGWYALKPASNVVSLGERELCSPAWADNEIIALMEAVLEYSIRQMSDAAFGRSSRLEAAAWALMPELDEEPFSFARCARAVGLDPVALRDGLRKCWKNKWGESL